MLYIRKNGGARKSWKLSLKTLYFPKLNYDNYVCIILYQNTLREGS